MAMDGKNVMLLILAEGEEGEFLPIAEQTSLSTENSNNLIDASSKDSDHTKWIYGKADDTADVEGLYTPDDAAYKMLQKASKEKKKVVLRRSENGNSVEEAEALIASISNDYPDNDNATVSVSFQLNESWKEVSA